MDWRNAARKPGVGYWYGFAACVALPAILLAVLGWRAVKLERIEQLEQAIQHRNQLVLLTETTLNTVLARIEREPGEGAAEAFELRGSGELIFPRSRIYFGESLEDPPPGRPILPPAAAALADTALASEAQGREAEALAAYHALRRMGVLQDWVILGLLRMESALDPEKVRERLDRFIGGPMLGVSPDGFPVALIAVSAVQQVPPDRQRPLVAATLKLLRGNTWWLSYGQRKFQDEELRRALGMAPDEALQTIAAMEPVARRLQSFRRESPVRITTQLGNRPALVLAAPLGAGGWAGAAYTGESLRNLFERALAAARSQTAYPIAVRDQVSGNVIWGAAGRLPHVAPIPSLQGWEVAMGEVAAESNRVRQVFSYVLIVLLLMVLAFGMSIAVRGARRESELARLQSAFTAGVTHEFKSPITTIQLLMERVAGGRLSSPEALQDYCSAICRETARLEHLVNRLLQTHKIEAGENRYHSAPHCIYEIAKTAIAHLLPQLEARKMRIELDADDTQREVDLDRTAIQDSIQNLIDNAMKYSPDGSRILVRIRHDPRGARIAVKDEGIGIEPSELSRIFVRFYRGNHGVERCAKGTGLGLWLVKSAAEGHGGDVEVKSTPGQGSEFCIRIPIRESDACLES